MDVKGHVQEPPSLVLGILMRESSPSCPGLKCYFLEVAELWVSVGLEQISSFLQPRTDLHPLTPARCLVTSQLPAYALQAGPGPDPLPPPEAC